MAACGFGTLGATGLGDLERGKQEKTKSLVFTCAFSTEREAELEGLQMAKKWIDDDKPQLQVGPT